MTTQERWFAPCRSKTIVGSAVDTIVWSSAARNIPSISATKIMRSAGPFSITVASSCVRSRGSSGCG